jgi:hypothetical protein
LYFLDAAGRILNTDDSASKDAGPSSNRLGRRASGGLTQGEMIRLFESGWSLRMLARVCGLSQQGVRYRLVSMGVDTSRGKR